MCILVCCLYLQTENVTLNFDFNHILIKNYKKSFYIVNMKLNFKKIKRKMKGNFLYALLTRK